jgi:hypothetical protein
MCSSGASGKRQCYLGELRHGDLDVERCGINVAMAEQICDFLYGSSLFDQPRGKAVAKKMSATSFNANASAL